MSAFKKQHPCPATGKTYGSCPGYTVDHVIPLKRGEADEPYNMHWQTTEAAKLRRLADEALAHGHDPTIGDRTLLGYRMRFGIPPRRLQERHDVLAASGTTACPCMICAPRTGVRK